MCSAKQQETFESIQQVESPDDCNLTANGPQAVLFLTSTGAFNWRLLDTV